MDLSFLNEYMVPVIVGICLCVGYILKNLFPKFDNRYIPAIVGILGLAVSIWMYWPDVTPEVVLIGLASGLCSTGLHQAVTQLVTKK